jgi:hypothetical protein
MTRTESLDADGLPVEDLDPIDPATIPESNDESTGCREVMQ